MWKRRCTVNNILSNDVVTSREQVVNCETRNRNKSCSHMAKMLANKHLKKEFVSHLVAWISYSRKLYAS